MPSDAAAGFCKNCGIEIKKLNEPIPRPDPGPSAGKPPKPHSKKLIGILLVVIVVAAAFLAIGATYTPEDDTEANGVYNYTLSTDFSIKYNGTVHVATTGNTYVFAETYIKNIDVTENGGIRPLYDFRISYGGYTYGASTNIIVYTTQAAGTEEFKLLAFVVPSDVDLSKTRLVYTGVGKLTHDKTYKDDLVLGCYNYSMTTPTSWVFNGTTYTVDTSLHTVVVVRIEMKNVGDSILRNMMAADFRLDYEGIRYTPISPISNPYPGLPGIYMYTSYGPGTQGYDIAIFDLPPGGVNLSKAELVYVGKYNAIYDPTFAL